MSAFNWRSTARISRTTSLIHVKDLAGRYRRELTGYRNCWKIVQLCHRTDENTNIGDVGAGRPNYVKISSHNFHYSDTQIITSISLLVLFMCIKRYSIGYKWQFDAVFHSNDFRQKNSFSILTLTRNSKFWVPNRRPSVEFEWISLMQIIIIIIGVRELTFTFAICYRLSVRRL